MMKFSEYPVGTVIDVRGLGRLEKRTVGDKKRWVNMGYAKILYANKYLKAYEKGNPASVKIISLPWDVVSHLIFMLKDEYGHYDAEGKSITHDSILKDAIKNAEASATFRDRREQYLKNYCVQDVKMTESLLKKLSKEV